MKNFPSTKAIVTLAKRNQSDETTITVGVSVCVGSTTTQPHFSPETLDRPASLHLGQNLAEKNEPPERVLWACALAAITGLEGFRQEFPKQVDCSLAVLEGKNLSDDFTVGFSLAARKAVARAVGASTSVDEAAYGWREIIDSD